MTGGDRKLPGIDGEPKLALPHPCCKHCNHPAHPQFTGHPSPCYRCAVEALAANPPPPWDVRPE